MRSFPFRTNQKLFETIKQKAKENNISINEWINKAIEHFLNCRIKEKEDVKQASLKLIVTKFSGKCSKCGNEISIGSLAYYGKDQGKTILICLDCMVENKSDKALASKYLKMRELNKTVKALRKEAESLAEKLEDLQIVMKFDNLYQKNDEVIRLIQNYLTNPFSKPEEQRLLEDVIDILKTNKRVAREIEDFIQSRLRLPKKIRRVSYE